MNNDIYYNFDKLFSYNFLLAFVIADRGCGKTFGAKVSMIKRFLKTGDEFIYLRRYKTELDMALGTFWDDIQSHGYFDDLELSFARKTGKKIIARSYLLKEISEEYYQTIAVSGTHGKTTVSAMLAEILLKCEKSFTAHIGGNGANGNLIYKGKDLF